MPVGVEAQPVAPGDRDRPRVDPRRRVGAGRGGGDRAAGAHSAAASWERAELWVQTNTTRGTGPHAGGGDALPGFPARSRT